MLLLCNLQAAGVPLNDVEVRFRNLTIHGKVGVGAVGMPTLTQDLVQKAKVRSGLAAGGAVVLLRCLGALLSRPAPALPLPLGAAAPARLWQPADHHFSPEYLPCSAPPRASLSRPAEAAGRGQTVDA